MPGVTDEGFDIKTLADILTEIETEQRAVLGANINLSSSSVLGQINGIVATKLSEMWEVAQGVYASQYPDTASGQALSYIGAITGTTRRAATRSTVTATVNLNNGTTLPAGSQARVGTQTLNTYRTTAAVSNTSGIAANVSVEMEAVELGAGPQALSGTLTTIVTPVSGWNSVTNALDSEPGLDEETDAELRVRRVTELTAPGSATVRAIRADVLEVEDVESVTVFENNTGSVDGNGLPGHSFEVLVVGGADDAIAQAIFDTKPAGIEAFGTDSGNAVDSEGVTQVVAFTRPEEIEIYLEVDIEIDSGDFPADGDAAIEAALVALEFEVGEDVILARLYPAILSIDGVLDIVEIRAGLTASPSGTVNLEIGAKQLAVLDSSRITIAHV